LGGSLKKEVILIPIQTISKGKLYDQFIKHFDVDKAYSELLKLAKKIGKPFEKKGCRGRPLGAEPEEYAAYFVFSWNEGHKLHGMERYSVKFLDKKLDHSTFGKIINRIPLFYFILLLEAFAYRIEQLIHTAIIAFADSTGITTGIYEERIFKGKTTIMRKDFKLHILAGYLPEYSLTYIKTALASDKHTSDAEGAKQMLERILEWIAYFLADKGYDAEKVHEACTKKGMIDVVKRKDRKSKMATYRSLTDKFFNTNLYKEIRGIIETIFGGLENKGLLKTKLKNPITIFKFSLASAIFHNQRTSIFARLIKIIAIFSKYSKK
jgi:hypothetical protein